jgi:hypothetical protein
MPRITDEEQQSSVRVSVLQSNLWRVILDTQREHPDLTYEEILAALIDVSGRNLMHLRRRQSTVAASAGDRE